MTETDPVQPGPSLQAGALAADDPLAAALLMAQRLLARLDAESDVRLRLHVRYVAICTSLKMPAANRARGAQRLGRLIAEIRAARASHPGRAANQDAGTSGDDGISA
jgi:hypothetical protein